MPLAAIQIVDVLADRAAAARQMSTPVEKEDMLCSTDSVTLSRVRSTAAHM
jgi:hypothetical protein